MNSRADTLVLQMFVNRLIARSMLTDEERQAILSIPVHAIQLPAKQDFAHTGEEASYSCLIASGMVGRFIDTVSGGRQYIAFHIPGDMADLQSVVRPSGVGGLSALCDTTILRVSHIAIRTLANRYPAIAEALWRDCMLDAAILMQWIVNVGRRSAQTRLAHIFCEMAIRLGGDRATQLNYEFPITQGQLADATGLTPVHVNRSLKGLRDDGLVSVGHGAVQIHNWDALAVRGEFEASYLIADTVRERQRWLLPA